ncbi:MAG: hypothetical protein Q4F97_10405 [Bacteroidales bacterium]|nr:hypothetical protein [Bacteroidales bacterium]
MNSYEFNVKMFANMRIEVVADSREEAIEMVKDVMENSCLKDIRLKEVNREDITISDSKIICDITDKNKSREAER